MIINVHTHVYPNPQDPANGEKFLSQVPVSQAVEQWKQRNVDHICVCPGGLLASIDPVDNGNDDVEKLMADWDGYFIGFGRVCPPKDGPDYVDQLADRGFKGLKLINTPMPYDDESLLPIYERAEKRGLVCLFHLGWLGHKPEMAANQDYLTRTHNMQPVQLDAIARRFGGLNLIGAHLGGRAYCQQAIDVAGWMPNVYFDLTGGLIRRVPWPMLQMLFGTQKEESLVDDTTVLNERVMAKMIFGSDNATPDVFLTFYKNLLNKFEASDQLQQKVMGKTLAGLLGM